MRSSALLAADPWEKAACVGKDPALWDLAPGRGRTLTPANLLAVEICSSCPVRSACLTSAVQERAEEQIRGGQAFWIRTQPARCEKCGAGFLRSTTRGNKAKFCGRDCWPRVGWAVK